MENIQTYLSIRLLPGGFSFSFEHPDEPLSDSHTVVAVTPGADYYDRMKEAFLQDERLLQSYDNVTCTVSTNRFTIVPPGTSAMVSHSMYSMALPDATEPEVLLTDDTNDDILLLFGIHEAFYHFLMRTFQDITFRHPISLLHHSYRTQQAFGEHAKLMVQATVTEMFVLLYQQQSLTMANRFETSQIENMCYYIANIWQQCQLDALHDTLVLQGDDTTLTHIHQQLSPYFKHIITT